jgi:hypothetical protein
MTPEKIEKVEKNFYSNLKELKSGLKDYFPQIESVAKSFGHPPMYFHHKALQEMENHFLKFSHIEAIYAMLPAWGMQKWGKIVAFENFSGQIEKRKSQLVELKNKNLSEVDIDELSKLLVSLQFSESNSYLVSSSKVLHHIIPNLVCPIDRQHSISFLLQDKNNFHGGVIINGKEEDYAKIYLSGMRDFIEENKTVLEKHVDKNTFNTSLTKIFDNLIMVFVRAMKNKKAEL